MSSFEKEVGIKYQVYNSLLLGLPFNIIHSTGVHLPILNSICEKLLKENKNPEEILEDFFSDYFAHSTEVERRTILFNVIKYVERQIVLFDAIEDAAFDKMNDLAGEGTIVSLKKRLQYKDRVQLFINKINDFGLHIVLTAHPTQFYPSTVLGIINSLDTAIRVNNIQEINDLLIQLGKTPFLKKQKPTPFDEAMSLIWYLENVFYESTSLICEEITQLLQANQAELKNNKLVTLGFWPGGDRDGNPTVNSEVTRKVSTELKKALFRKYHADVSRLKQKLTFKHTEELLCQIEERLYLGLHDPDHSYRSAEELLLDVNQVKKTIIDLHDGLFIHEIDEFTAKIELFGIHFASLDIRQDSRVIGNVIQQILNKFAPDKINKFNEGTEQEKIEIISSLTPKIEPQDLDGDQEQDVLASLSDMRWAQEQNGPEACKRYIISNCKSALDVIQVLLLARWTAWGETMPEIDIVPLFESIDDLAGAAEIMNTLYSNKLYQQHLLLRSKRQTVMLGFSDGTKDGGYMSANWSIYKAKETISEVSSKAGIRLAFFDGRGGPPARGGGNTNKFYSALGSSIEHHEIQLTVQGQTISSNFGNVVSAKYNIEQLLTAGIESDVFPGDIPEISESQKLLISEISDLSYKTYRDLKNHEYFLDYLQQLGTLDYYNLTNISSRPVKRASDKKLSLDDLRAIPFVAAWSLLKQNIPGYYGLGTALEKFNDLNRLKEIQDLYKSSQFFQTLIDNCMQVLMKTNFNLTAHYSEHPAFGPLWKILHAEFLRTSKFIQIISGKNLMEDNPGIKSSIHLREKIVLPLLIIQQAALQKIRKIEKDSESQLLTDYRNLVLRSMFGIINAARNSV